MRDAYMAHLEGVVRVSRDKSRSLIVRFVAGIYQTILCLVGMALIAGGFVVSLTLGMLGISAVVYPYFWFGKGWFIA